MDSAEFLYLVTVVFAKGDSAISKTASGTLKQLAATMAEHGAAESYFVVGNALPDEERAEELSQQRADVVKQALVDLGIAGARLEARGAGAFHPVWEPTPERAVDQKASRRVLFDITFNRSRSRRWYDNQHQVDYVIPDDLPCVAPKRTPGKPCPGPK